MSLLYFFRKLLSRDIDWKLGLAATISAGLMIWNFVWSRQMRSEIGYQLVPLLKVFAPEEDYDAIDYAFSSPPNGLSYFTQLGVPLLFVFGLGICAACKFQAYGVDVPMASTACSGFCACCNCVGCSMALWLVILGHGAVYAEHFSNVFEACNITEACLSERLFDETKITDCILASTFYDKYKRGLLHKFYGTPFNKTDKCPGVFLNCSWEGGKECPDQDERGSARIPRYDNQAHNFTQDAYEDWAHVQVWTPEQFHCIKDPLQTCKPDYPMIHFWGNATDVIHTLSGPIYNLFLVQGIIGVLLTASLGVAAYFGYNLDAGKTDNDSRSTASVGDAAYFGYNLDTGKNDNDSRSVLMPSGENGDKSSSSCSSASDSA